MAYGTSAYIYSDPELVRNAIETRRTWLLDDLVATNHPLPDTETEQLDRRRCNPAPRSTRGRPYAIRDTS